jgi:ribonuclease J
MGMESGNIFISDIGNVLEIDKNGAKISGTVTAGKVLVDGYGVGDVGSIVLRDRLLLSQDGLIVVVATISSDGGYLLSGPDIVSRGFVYVRESEDLMEEMRRVALESISGCLNSRSRLDWYHIKGKVKDDLAKYIYTTTKRKPMIIPMIMNV